MSEYSFRLSVVDSDGRPVPGANVRVFDVDPLQDDPLRSSGGVTDDDGKLQASLDPSEFRPTTIPGFAFEGEGPNLYFHVDKGPLSLHEDRSAGWAADRAVKPDQVLSVPLMLGGSAPWPTPQFTHIGDFQLGGHISPAGTTTGPQNGHGGPKFAFHKTLTLRGKMPAKWEKHKVQYRFLWNNTIPIMGNMIANSNLGVAQIDWKDTSPNGGTSPAAQTVQVGSTASAPDSGASPIPIQPMVIAPMAGGWITIPDGVTVVPDTLLRFVTATSSVHLGGASTSSADVGVTGSITFQARLQLPNGNTTPVFWTNTQIVRINNWVPEPGLDIKPAPCLPVEDELDLEYHFDHEYPLKATLTVTTTGPSPDGHTATTQLAASPRGWDGVHTVQNNKNLSNNQNLLANWAPCPYTVNFWGSLRLTDGFVDAGSLSAPPRTFCKKKKDTMPS